MAYTIVNSYIPTSLHPLKAPYTMVPEYITIHNTYNDATAANEIAYMTRNTTVVGYHVAIDDKQAIQAIPFNRNAFHAGDGGKGNGNRKSIGIEICYSKSGGPKYIAAEENTVEYVAHVLKQYGWGIDRVKWHRDWSGKKCPHRIIDEGRTQSVKDRIAERLAELSNPLQQIAEDEREVDEMAEQLPQTQKDDMRALLKRAHNEKVFSVDHTSKVDTMTRGQATDLLISYVARTK
ncbi:peptidoglycan recognition protein family protein [Sporosarcina sp. FSL K6-3457]|uniref:peptidoglycan recognition protein family protein n=1 Tax=Sporosarcina sp. FSL K6-3457 TaxID=2978204 RepID=UPI0030F605E2